MKEKTTSDFTVGSLWGVSGANRYLLRVARGRWNLAETKTQRTGRDGGLKPLILLVLIVAGTILCFKTVTFYFKVLFRAEHFAQQAVCGECKTYGAIEVTAAPDSAPDSAESESEAWLKVRCRKCGHAWTISGEPIVLPAGKST